MTKGRGAKKKVDQESDGFEEKKKGTSKLYIAGVLVLALVMIAILGAISFFSEPEAVDLKDLDGHEGDEVVCKGVVVSLDVEEHSTNILLYQDGTVARIDVEERTDKAEVNDRIKVRGEVYKSGNSYAVQVVGENSIEVLGEAEPEEVYPGNIHEYNNEYVMLDGVVAAVSKDPWGGGTAQVLGIPDIGSAGNWSATCMIRFSDCPYDLNSTDRVTAYGVVREGDDGAYLYVYDEDAIRIEEDYWEPKNMTLGMLSELVEKGSEEFMSFEVKVSGYLKYEPGGYGSITLTEHPSEGEFSLKVETRDMECDQEMAKGDLLVVHGLMEYDREGLRYVLNAQWGEVVEIYGIWNVTVEELVKNYYLYENAWVSVNGCLESVGDDIFLVDGDHRLRTNARGDWKWGEHLQYYGWLQFNEEELYYYLDMSEP